jgi:hypothetical protein
MSTTYPSKSWAEIASNLSSELLEIWISCLLPNQIYKMDGGCYSST